MSKINSIRILPDNVANKIAAGEVVERPASVLKELIENALDAQASRINVEITAGGRNLVSVADNGQGMNRDNAMLAIERHATSKILDVHDIERVETLGFRGEALPAIASVSRFRLVTNDSGKAPASEITISGGKLQDVQEIGAPVGTKIEVRNLFFNVPARRKFLRTYQTEFSHLKMSFIVQALAHPSVSMSLKSDNKSVYKLPAGELNERLLDIFGTDYLAKLRPVKAESTGGKVSGFVSIPTFNRPDRKEQFVFVNGRAVSSALTSRCISEAYRGLVPGDRHPMVFLFIQIDPETVDVNVHPTKKEVRFRRSSEVRDMLINSIRNALRHNTENIPAHGETTGGQPATRVSEMMLDITDLPSMPAFNYPGLHHSQKHVQTPTMDQPFQHEGGGEPENTVRSEKNAPWSWCRVLGQIGSLYVVLEIDDGMVLMDPHASHERVLFEKFMKRVLNNAIQTQKLLMPETVNLGSQDARNVRKNMESLRLMGFGISEFGEDTFIVDSLPSYFTETSPRQLLLEISATLERAGKRGGTERWREEAIAQAACKAAVKARDKLTLQEIEQLVIDLAQTDMPYTCPHGRPTVILTSYQEISRKFKRI